MQPLQTIVSVLAFLVIVGCSASEESDPQVQPRESLTIETANREVTPSLDGKTFVVDFRERGKGESYRDTLTFADGTFRSVGCDQYGFSAAPCTLSAEGETVGFTASATSEAEGRMDWAGTVTGDSIEGGVRWTKEGQDPIDYEYSGTLQ